MFWLVETQDQIESLINIGYEEAFVEIIQHNDKIHPALDDVCLVYYRPINETKGYIICIDHSEALKIGKQLVNELLCKTDVVWVRDKKHFLYHFQIKSLRDVNILTPPYIQDLTQTHIYFQDKYPDYKQINKIIPLTKHYEVCNKIYNTVKPSFTEDLPSYFDFYNNKSTLAFFGIEKNGIPIDKDQFDQYFKPTNPTYSIGENRIYTQYNLFTTTKRPSNRFNGINFAALNKENGERKCFKPQNSTFIELDISAYHPTLLAKLCNYSFNNSDIHGAFAEMYGVDYSKAKEITFKQIYGGIWKEYEALEFFQKVKEYTDNIWEEYNTTGKVVVPISGYHLEKDKLENMNPQKLLNYILQNVETATNVCILMQLHRLLNGKKTKLVLYTYDSFLFDLDETENLIDEINKIFENLKLHTKISYGSSYDFNHPA